MSSTRTVTWLAGNPGDGWYEMTAAWVELLDDGELRLQFAAGGGEENLTSVAAGRAEFGMSIDVVAAAAYNGGRHLSRAAGLRGPHLLRRYGDRRRRGSG
jgi:TRAP-type uncharacterized transport system substrate-binding protein